MMAGAFQLHGQTIINGSFEQGGGSFTGWTTIGGVTIASSSVTTPTSGSVQAFMDNVLSTAVSASLLSAFFNSVALPANTQGAATNGSGIEQTFTITEPTTLSFDYKYITAESIGSGWDETFYYIDGRVVLLADPNTANVATLGTNGITAAGNSYVNGLPYKTVSITLGSGTHTIGFGVYNTGDTVVNTGLFVDNVLLGVPEPGTVALLASGLAVLAGAGWRRRAAKR
jgi:hypothetical protein